MTQEELTDEERLERAKRRVARKEVIGKVDAAWTAESNTLRRLLAVKNRKLKKLQEDIDATQAEIVAALEQAGKAWDKTMDVYRFPVDGGDVVALTKQRSENELLLNIGDDEWFVISGGQRHHYGAARDEKGTRQCFLCGHMTVLPVENLSVIPKDLPANIREAIKEQE